MDQTDADREEAEEEEHAREALKERRLKRRYRLKKAAIAAAVLAIICWRFHLLAPLGVAWGEFLAEVEKTRDPHLHFKPEASVEPIAVLGAKPEVAVSSFVYLPSSAVFAAPQPELAPPAEAPPSPETLTPLVLDTPEGKPEPVVGMRRWYGVVYDLITLKPAANVTLILTQNNSAKHDFIPTGLNGRYHFELPREYETNQVRVSIAAPGYREGLIEDHDPPLRERSAERRKAFAAETTESDLEPVPLRFRESDEVIGLDLVLVPAKKIK